MKTKNNTMQSKLANHKGRFVTLSVTTAKSGKQTYSAKIQKVTDSTVLFWDANAKKSVRANLRNVS